METQVNRTMNCLQYRKKGCKFRNTKFGLTRVSAPKGRFDKPEQCISLSQVTQYVIHKRNIILINYYSLAVPTSSWYSLKTLLLLIVVAHISDLQLPCYSFSASNHWSKILFDIWHLCGRQQYNSFWVRILMFSLTVKSSSLVHGLYLVSLY